MEIRIRETGAVVTEREFRAMHPNTSFPAQLNEELLNDMGADVVLEGPQATPTSPYQFSMRQGVEQVDGKWFTKYVLGPVFTEYTDPEGVLHTAAEQEAEYRSRKDTEQGQGVRGIRNTKLKDSDWTQVADAPVDKVAWAAYRQALRDITAQPGFPWTVQWPSTPTSG